MIFVSTLSGFIFIFQLSGSYDVVINCSGFGARELCGDNRVEPIRGQIMRVITNQSMLFFNLPILGENI